MEPKEIKKLLIDKDLTVTELAGKVGLKRTHLSLIIHGHRKGKQYWPKIAKALNIELQEVT